VLALAGAGMKWQWVWMPLQYSCSSHTHTHALLCAVCCVLVFTAVMPLVALPSADVTFCCICGGKGLHYARHVQDALASAICWHCRAERPQEDDASCLGNSLQADGWNAAQSA
jgi:hypothetical protein